MNLNTVQRLESNIRGYVRSFPTVFDTAQGAWQTDVNGRRYLDFFAGGQALKGIDGYNSVHEFFSVFGVEHTRVNDYAERSSGYWEGSVDSDNIGCTY